MITPHCIFYRRPETPWSLSRITTRNTGEAEAQVKRLVALGYSVTEILPPLTGPSDIGEAVFDVRPS